MIDLRMEMRRLLYIRLASVIQETREIEKELLKKQVDDATVTRMSTVTAKLEVIESILGEGIEERTE